MKRRVKSVTRVLLMAGFLLLSLACGPTAAAQDISSTDSIYSTTIATQTSLSETVTPSTLQYLDYGSGQLTIKSNSIGWVLGIVNVGVEYEFAPRWSFEFPLYYSCWNYFGHNLKFRTFAVEPEFKFYFDRKEHVALGVHILVGYYNWAFRGAFRYQTHSRKYPMAGGGLSLTYRSKLDRAGRWGLELSAGFGVYDNRYDRYPLVPCECDPTDLSHYVNGKCICRLPAYGHKAFYGLDKLTISFSYTFDLNRQKQR